jgi:hypothetical protein
LTNEPSKPTRYEYWKGVHDSIIGWYALADSKASAIITLNGILLSFVGLGVILGAERGEISTEFRIYFFGIILSFVGTIIFSVFYAVLGVARGFNKPRLYTEGMLLTYFGDIAAHFGDRTCPDFKRKINKNHEEQTLLNNQAEELSKEQIKKYTTEEERLNNQAEKFLNKQIKKYTTEEERLWNLAVNIVNLSNHLDRKMKLIRRSFHVTIVSILLLGAIVSLLSFDRTFMMNSTAPDVEITEAIDRRNIEVAEGGTTPTPYIRIPFEATDGIGVENTKCSLDGQAFTVCTSPVSYDRLSEGTHQFTVRATDTAGNIGDDEFT